MSETTWEPWRVADCFEVDDPGGHVGLCQVTRKDFEVTTTFRFVGAAALDDLRAGLRGLGHDDAVADAISRDAAHYAARTELTDLASIPPFMRWFVNTYGRHTLAAVIHDRLIASGEPNSGVLGSDTLADRFFRQMLGAAGVPRFKRWIMWAATAMRSRWAAMGWRRATLVVWVAAAAVGIALAVNWGGVVFLGWGRLFGLSSVAMALIAILLPLASAVLWGRQYGASIVAAAAALWLLPAAVFGVVGYGVYRALEWLVGRVAGRDGVP